jgi:alpha-glucosidase
MKKSTGQNPGSIQEFRKIPNGILVKSENANLRINFYNDHIVRITFSREAEFDDQSYSVVAQPASVKFECVDDGKAIRLAGPFFHIVLSRKDCSIRMETPEGKVINEDEPGLPVTWIGDQVSTYKTLREGERFVGLGEKTGPLDRRGAGYQNWTTDAYAYNSGSDPLYCSTPFYIGIHEPLVYGLFLDNSYKSFFNFGASNNRFSSFAADAGDMNYYFVHGPDVATIIEQYTWLTGRMEMPPIWSIGYQQCRYSYYPDKEVKNLAVTFREKNIPADVIVLDIHYMDKYKIFTWDKTNFSDPNGLIAFLRQSGFHVVVMCDPGIKVEPGYKAYDDGLADDVFLKYPDGKPYSGQVWPGWCHFPDFTNPKTRDWWTAQLKQYVDTGLDGFWNDMNEIATWGHSLPENIEFNFDGQPATTRKGRNLFGFQMARATYEGTKKLMGGKRPFNLTRSGFSGVQRYAAVWTGDNVSYDEHMLLGVRLVNSLGMTGVAFAGYDAGGFVGEASPRLFARWISIAALSPFFRGHTMINSKDAEPWSFGEEVEQIARNFISLRYQLMPYIYSLFHFAVQKGTPIQRSLAIDYSFEPRVFSHAYHNQYLFGPSILVAPVESHKDLCKVFLPAGRWFSIYDGLSHDGGKEIIVDSPVHKLPVFISESAILPMKEAGTNTADRNERLIIHIYNGSVPSSFLLYEDDGDTFEYQDGSCSTRLISFDPANWSIKLTAVEGAFNAKWKTLGIVFHAFKLSDTLNVNNRKVNVGMHEHSFFKPLEKYDPINDPDSMGSEKVSFIEIPFTRDAITIDW